MVDLRDNFRAGDNLKNGSFTATGDFGPESQPGICAVNVNGSHETSLVNTASSHREASKSVLSSSVRSQIFGPSRYRFRPSQSLSSRPFAGELRTHGIIE